MSELTLYSYWRSSAAYRVRIALNLKNVPYQTIPIHLVKDGGQQHQPDYRAVNPQGLVPSLRLADGTVLTQSVAIIEYLEAAYPEPSLLPSDPVEAAKVRAMGLLVACDVHPLNNLRVLQYLKESLKVVPDEVSKWYHHWICEGFTALEKLLAKTSGQCCWGDVPSFADVCLVPQVYNARRFNVDMSAFPNIVRVDGYLQTLEAFAAAAPENQIDAVLAKE